MSSSPEPNFANGNASPTAEGPSLIDPDDRISGSELSDAYEHAAAAQPFSAASSPSERAESPDNAQIEVGALGEESSDEDNNASDDADFDMDEDAAASQSDVAQDAVSSSNSSRGATKRKADVGEDSYMRENPELYGLRRSVCLAIIPSYCHTVSLTSIDSPGLPSSPRS